MTKLLTPEMTGRALRSRAAAPRRKTVLNVRLLAATLLLVGCATPSLYLWYRYQHNGLADVLWQHAKRAEAKQEWSQAASFFQRFLVLRPDDAQALGGLADALSHDARTDRQRRRLNAVLYQALGKQSDNHQLQLKLAENLLEVREYQSALTEATKLLDSASHSAAAHRVKALALYALSHETDKESFQEAAKGLLEAVAKLPGDPQLAGITGALLRTRPEAFQLSEPQAHELADRIINDMVAASPENVNALLARYRYRSQFRLPEAQADLTAALEASPDHFDTLMLSADAALRGAGGASAELATRSGEAEGLIRRAIKSTPGDPRGYVALARVLEQRGDLGAAIKEVRRGRQTVGPDNLDLALALPSLLIRAKQFDEGEKVLKELERNNGEQLAQLPATARRQLENQTRLMAAQLDLAHNRASSAVVKLRAVLASVGSESSARVTSEALQASSLLAGAMSALGRWEAAAQHWQDLADSIAEASTNQQQGNQQEGVLRLQANARLAAAQAFLKADQPDAAVGNLDRYVQLVGMDANAAVLLMKSHLKRQLQRPPDERNWREFHGVLETAQKLAPASWEAVFAEVEYLLASADGKADAAGTTSTGSSQALALLRASESRFQKEPLFWQGAVVAYQRLKQEADANRALDQYVQLEPSPVKTGPLKSFLLAKQGRWEEADAYLVELTPTLVQKQRLQIGLQRLRLMVAGGKLDAAKELVRELIAAHSDAAEILEAGIELALLTNDYKAAAQWEPALEKLVGKNDFDLRFLTTKRLVDCFADLTGPDRQKLQKELQLLRTERPRWRPIVSLAAKYAALTGDSDSALREYRLAIELGDGSAETLQSVIDLLARAGEFDEAERYLARLSSSRPDDDQLESFAISLALRQNDVEQALSRAQQAVQRSPSDPLRRIWLANALALNQRNEEAESEFLRATKDFPADAGVWSNWFAYLVRSGQPDRAREALTTLLKQVALPEGQRHFVAGQAYEQLGDADKARAEFELAIAAEPANVAYRMRLAKGLLAVDMRAARAELERVLKIDADNADARRQLATLLAATGQEEDWDAAMKLLQAGASAPLMDDDRLRALLLTRKGRTSKERQDNLKAAREILSGQLKRRDNRAADVDRMLLAAVYEKEAALLQDISPIEAGREALRPLVDRANPTDEALALYIKYLLRSVESPIVANLSENDREPLREAFLTDAETRLIELSRRAPKNTPGDSLEVTSLRLGVLKARGREDEAVELLKQFVTSHREDVSEDNEKAQFYLAVGNLYSSLDRHEEAQAWYKQLMSIAPGAYVMLVKSLAAEGKIQDAVEVCLEIAESKPSAAVAATLAQLLTSPQYQGERLKETEAIIASSLEANHDDLQLLLASAVLHVSRNEIDQAIGLLRRVVELAPDHTLALNNLATLLGERSEGRAEALEHIGRAIEIAGRKAPLLDTQGTIYLLAGDFKQAVSCLEEAVASGGGDPRYYFHLAAAYQRAGRTDDARQALDLSRSQGLDRSLLTDSDRKLLSELEGSLGSTASIN